jgi:hypothetical protein
MINKISLLAMLLLAASSLASAKDWGSMTWLERATWAFKEGPSYCIGGKMVATGKSSPEDLNAAQRIGLGLAFQSVVIREIQKNCVLGPTQPVQAAR